MFGNYETFPLWVYGAVKVGIPPQVFVIGTVIFMVGLMHRPQPACCSSARRPCDPGARGPPIGGITVTTQIDIDRYSRARRRDRQVRETQRLLERTPALREAATGAR